LTFGLSSRTPASVCRAGDVRRCLVYETVPYIRFVIRAFVPGHIVIHALRHFAKRILLTMPIAFGRRAKFAPACGCRS
jgi:hypothetical protein